MFALQKLQFQRCVSLECELLFLGNFCEQNYVSLQGTVAFLYSLTSSNVNNWKLHFQSLFFNTTFPPCLTLGFCFLHPSNRLAWMDPAVYVCQSKSKLNWQNSKGTKCLCFNSRCGIYSKQLVMTPLTTSTVWYLLIIPDEQWFTNS